MKKVELLAPAGNYEGLKGAIAAGADAVYLGGNAFGARAYADNFTKEEICNGIRFAHVFGKKIYLTVNTLVKEREFSRLYDFLLPFYEAGLDGVIIQDLGVFQFIKQYFPNLSLHVSTQMTITGVLGAEFIKEAGAERIVPARELSLTEIKHIKEKADIEIETFIHGAMCYCYSGQCLFSSILGGRSGNRGRCAQPCRLPYTTDGSKEYYPLSMKDMCTIEDLPLLIEAGIDSFKIEGRMKKPEYAAGVVSIYRKYIDQYYDSPSTYKVSDEDMEYLKSLYIRSDIMPGYYHKHNGKDMITLSSPGYTGSNDNLLAQIRDNYIEKALQLPISAHAFIKKDAVSQLTFTYNDIEITVSGMAVQKAMKQPLAKEKVREQLLKCGNSCFDIISLILDIDDDIFMPVSALNQLRRDAIAALEKSIISHYGLNYPQRKAVEYNATLNNCQFSEAHAKSITKNAQLHVVVGNRQQLQSAMKADVSRIYIDRDAIDENLLESLYQNEWSGHFSGELYLAFPYIVRQKDEEKMLQLYKLLQKPYIAGALVRNLGTLSLLKKQRNQKPIVTDANLYTYNAQAFVFFGKYASEVYLPIELNKHEIKDLTETISAETAKFSNIVYGRLPLMISANCVKKTTDKCNKKVGFSQITDRYHKEFPVYTDCVYCYNILYNSVPLSLHGMFFERNKMPYAVRLDFTTEDADTTGLVINYFKDLISGQKKETVYSEFTTGHYKRGVE